MTQVDLSERWTLRPTGGPIPAGIPTTIPATVPGTVHTDLMAAGHIPDPYLDTNEQDVAWIAESDFDYETVFTAPGRGHERIDLVAEGLDTVATLSLNGAELGRTRNQHRSYRFDLRDRLADGDNRLCVSFSSALNFASEAETRIGARPYVGNKLPYNAVRKMASNFGWDWGPTLVTAGIWKPIYLHAWSTARIASVVPAVTVKADGTGHVLVRTVLERTSPSEISISATLTGPDGEQFVNSVTTGESNPEIEIDVPQAALWWPRGYGDQSLYQLQVAVKDSTGVLDTWSKTIGFRTVELRNERDEFGTSFQFVVNGQYVWIKGANWIPDDCFLPRLTAQSYAAGVRDAVDADFNLLRIWGGGIYESDVLYDLCNREGIMIWQDFPFACAAYSEASELWDEVEAEARENVARLANHPSLIFWNGSNENIEGYYEWGWKDLLGEGVDWGRGYYDDLLPRVLDEVDGTRPYLPSSPFSPNDYTNPRNPADGSVHSWEVWNRQDYSTYRDAIPRFVAEFGFQGPPNYSTIERSIHDIPLAADSTGMLAHQKADDGNGKLDWGLARHLPKPGNFDDWHFATQLNQARAITYGIEHFRSHSPRTAGTILWQLNDCWPVTSWAAVDGDRRRKPLWFALRAVNAARLLTFQPRAEGLSLIASNDSDHQWVETIVVERLNLNGTRRAGCEITIAVAPRSNQSLVLIQELTAADDPTKEFIIARSENAQHAFWYFVEDVDLALPPLSISSNCVRRSGTYRVQVVAKAFVKDMVINVDRLDPAATIDNQLVTLLPGETAEFMVTSDADFDPALLLDSPVLQSVNSLIHAQVTSTDPQLAGSSA